MHTVLHAPSFLTPCVHTVIQKGREALGLVKSSAHISVSLFLFTCYV